MPPLPQDRVRRLVPFQSIGIDYLGPTGIKVEDNPAKAWIVLITCLTTRAVYLEPAFDLSGDSLMHVFLRFVHRRGRPLRVLSDNGTQFRLVVKAISQACSGLERPVEWKFIPQISPWQGGVYERLLGLVKAAFKATLGRKLLTAEGLRTFTAEAEGAINSRPITYVDGGGDEPMALRPIDFIQPTVDVSCDLAWDKVEEDSPTGARLRQEWVIAQRVYDAFWERWQKEYLMLLRERGGWSHKGQKRKVMREPKVGEVVLIEEAWKPRNL
jgi:hypothetical protein